MDRQSIQDRTRDQLGFGLYYPGAEMMPAASLHGMHENERQILSEHLEHLEHLDRLQSGGLRSIGRGYPARWLIAVLNQRHVPL